MQQVEKNYLVFVCYGAKAVAHECLFALISLADCTINENGTFPDVWIYTDNPSLFQAYKDCPIKLNFRVVDQSTLKDWRGKIDFTHRVKIEVLRDFTKDRSGNILYTDTDVIFNHDPAPIFRKIAQGQLFMHVMEGIVSDAANPILHKLNKHLSAHNRKLPSGQMLRELPMWNAGVLGFNTRYNSLLDQVLEFTDNEYAVFPKHIIEQFAFSVYFQNQCPITSAAYYITHYWNLKEIRTILDSFFERFNGYPWNVLQDRFRSVQIPVLLQEKSNFYSNRSMAGKIMKKKWVPATPNWKTENAENDKLD